MTKVVVGIDGSEESAPALTWALSYAAAAGAKEVACVYAYDPPLAWIDVGSDYADNMIDHAVKQASAELDSTIAAVDAPRGVVITSSVQQGTPADVLVDASGEADLLVVGSRGRGGFAGLLLGSVSQRCAERAPCPVVVVPAPTRN